MKKFITFVLCSLTFGCLAGLAHASDYDETHPALSFAAFKPIAADTKKVCECTKGEECTCGENCTCADGIGGCGKGAARRAARRAARAGGGGDAVAIDEATYAVGFEPQQMAIMQPVQAVQQVQVASVDPDVCPCCGMKMNAEQKATMKAKQAAPPVQTVPIQPYTTTYTTVPTYASAPMFGGYYGAGGVCVGGNCVGGNCGTTVVSRFRRWR